MPEDKDFPMEPMQPDDDIEIEFLDQEVENQEIDAEPEPEGLEPVPEAGLEKEAENLKAELDHVRDIYLRKLAEFDNFRKRVEREREDSRLAGVEEMVRELLPVLDNFERALQHAEDDSGAFQQGVEMIAKQLWDTLERRGVKEVNPVGQPFDPELHEAVQRVEDGQHAPGTVAWVMLKGYTMGDRLVRPAMVGVAVEPNDDSNGGGGES
ncbi:MAG: nucleotide exchange factor GrpE [Thermoanaerobaculales bacterium]|nr:nucleotide exchange factor GrpE [Thermoanaerobaculales bacterium]